MTIRREDAPKLDGRVRVVLRAPRKPSTGWNVVGELPGRRRGAPTIVAGHHDGWFRAAFDDATGVAVTLELARAFAEAGIRPERTIAFVSHTAEEYGIAESAYDWCYGAWYQVVAEHREWTTGSPFYLNVEGSGSRGDSFTLDVPPELTGWIRRHCRAAERDGLLPHGWKLDRPNTWTEVWPFLAAGIPAINVSTFTDEFERTEYHTQFDTTETVDFGYLAKLTELCGRLLLDEPVIDFAPRVRELAKHGVWPGDLSGDPRKRFTALARGLHGLDAIDAPRYPHEQTAADVEHLERALEDPDKRRGPPRARGHQLALLRPVARGLQDRAPPPRPAGAPRLLGRDGRRRSGPRPLARARLAPRRAGRARAGPVARAEPSPPPRALPPGAGAPDHADGLRLRRPRSTAPAATRARPSWWRIPRVKPLPPGGTIGVAAPASPYDSRSEILRGVEWWESQGYRVKLADGVYERDDYVAGDAEQRARRPERALRRPRGGRRAGPPGRLRLGADDPVPRLRRDRGEPEAARRLLRHHGAPRRRRAPHRAADDLRERPRRRRRPRGNRVHAREARPGPDRRRDRPGAAESGRSHTCARSGAAR